MAKSKQESKEQEWSAADYLKRKAERREKTPPRWFVNPETGERFYIRPVGAMAFVVAGQMQHVLTADAVDAWQKEGVEIPTNGHDEDSEEQDLAKLIEQGNRHAQIMAKVLQTACVIPRIVLGAKKPGEIDPTDLEDSDLKFIYRVATGQQGNALVPLKGGESTTVATIKSVPGKSRKRSGTIARG